MASNSPIVKVVLLGSSAVGKTSILLRQSGQGFAHTLSSTIGASFCRSIVNIDENNSLQLQIWDTAGQERFRAMTPMYYRNASAAVIVYDITKKSTFTDAKVWVAELNQNADSVLVICLVGNKADLESHREVLRNQGEAYAMSIGALFFETSALSSHGVTELFYELAQALHDRKILLEEKRQHFLQNLEDTIQTPKHNYCCTSWI